MEPIAKGCGGGTAAATHRLASRRGTVFAHSTTFNLAMTSTASDWVSRDEVVAESIPGGPRPLLISNSDKDRIFPLDGVVDVHREVREIYRLYDAEDNLGLQITEGPH